MTQALIAFGANAGDPRKRFSEATELLAKVDGITVEAIATPVVTAAVSGKTDAETIGSRPNDYLNSVILVESTLSAQQLFKATSQIENQMGRQRKERWGPRSIDLDILLFGQQKISVADLQIPHPRMSFRKFVIEPATEIAPDFIEPTSGVTLKALSRRLTESPAKIAWINGNSKQNQLAKSVLATLDGGGWGYEIAANLSELKTPMEDFRLLAFAKEKAGNKADDKATSDFEIAAASFAGPWLNVAGLSQMECQREILGAVQAMT